MSFRWRVLLLFAVLVTLAGVAIPPVIEDHLEPGFCSADCPVQHAGHGVGITTRAQALRAHPAPVFIAPLMLSDDGPIARPDSADSPRAPPSA